MQGVVIEKWLLLANIKMTDALSKEEALQLDRTLTDELQPGIESGQLKTLDDVVLAVTIRSDAIEQQLAAAGVPTASRNRRWRLVFDKRRHCLSIQTNTFLFYQPGFRSIMTEPLTTVYNSFTTHSL